MTYRETLHRIKHLFFGMSLGLVISERFTQSLIPLALGVGLMFGLEAEEEGQ